MKFQIKRRLSNDTLIEGDANSLKEFVENNKKDLRNSDLSNCNLNGSNLRNSDLSYCNLENSNLRNSDLRNSDLSNCNLKLSQKDELLKALLIEIEN